MQRTGRYHFLVNDYLSYFLQRYKTSAAFSDAAEVLLNECGSLIFIGIGEKNFLDRIQNPAAVVFVVISKKLTAHFLIGFGLGKVSADLMYQMID